LTFTRTGLIVMTVSALVVSGMRARARGIDRGVWLLGALAALVVALFVVTRPAQSVWLRMTSEGQDSWYRARVDAPSELAMATNGAQYVDVTVTNTGRAAWDASGEDAIALSYHWLDASGTGVVAYEGARTDLAESVAPEATVAIKALVRA